MFRLALLFLLNTMLIPVAETNECAAFVRINHPTNMWDDMSYYSREINDLLLKKGYISSDNYDYQVQVDWGTRSERRHSRWLESVRVKQYVLGKVTLTGPRNRMINKTVEKRVRSRDEGLPSLHFRAIDLMKKAVRKLPDCVDL